MCALTQRVSALAAVSLLQGLYRVWNFRSRSSSGGGVLGEAISYPQGYWGSIYSRLVIFILTNWRFLGGGQSVLTLIVGKRRGLQ